MFGIQQTTAFAAPFNVALHFVKIVLHVDSQYLSEGFTNHLSPPEGRSRSTCATHLGHLSSRTMSQQEHSHELKLQQALQKQVYWKSNISNPKKKVCRCTPSLETRTGSQLRGSSIPSVAARPKTWLGAPLVSPAASLDSSDHGQSD